jgi:hypothetical protein
MQASLEAYGRWHLQRPISTPAQRAAPFASRQTRINGHGRHVVQS